MLYQHSSINYFPANKMTSISIKLIKSKKNSLNLDVIVCDNARNLDQILDENTVDLSIVKPPYHNLDEKPEKQIALIREIMEKITKVSKIGGICCLITSEDMTEKGMDATELKALFEFMDNSGSSSWEIIEKITWVKSPEKGTEPLFPIEKVKLISFDMNPFSVIWIMIKIEKDMDYEFDISKNINNLRISESKKQEMMDSVWFIPQKSEQGFKDHLPKELVLRLLMILSEENNLVLDPFSKHGITAVASNILKRHFICIDKNEGNTAIAKRRIENI